MKWNYDGDMNIESGGTFWRESGYADHVDAVEIIPASLLGGPDCVFIIRKGSIYIGTDEKLIAEFVEMSDAAESTGDELRRAIVMGAAAYRGIDSDYSEIVQIGKLSKYDPEMPNGFSVSVYLKGNWKLKNYVRKNYL